MKDFIKGNPASNWLLERLMNFTYTFSKYGINNNNYNIKIVHCKKNSLIFPDYQIIFKHPFVHIECLTKNINIGMHLTTNPHRISRYFDHRTIYGQLKPTGFSDDQVSIFPPDVCGGQVFGEDELPENFLINKEQIFCEGLENGVKEGKVRLYKISEFELNSILEAETNVMNKQ